GPENQDHNEGRQIRPPAEPAKSGAEGIAPQLFSRRCGKDANVVMRASVDTIKAESAIDVTRFPRLVQVEFASRDAVPSTDTVLGSARAAHGRVAHLDFRRRNQRLHEIELADRTHILAKRSPAKETVHDEGSSKVADRYPGGPPGTIPESKGLI